jgi:recombination protein RecT
MSDNKELLQQKVLGQFTQYDINTLKSTIAAGLNSAEFGLFLNTCVATGLNPFLKQVIPVVYESQKNGRRFDIQVPVEGIEHLARDKEGWGGYDIQLVCENDVFKARRDKESGAWIIEEHEINFPRGKTMGAYCIVPRKGFKDVVIFMEVTEVSHLLEDFKTKNMWAKWFNDMFKKHVKKRALREQFGIEIDDMSDLSVGPEKYDNSIPNYQPQQRQEIQQQQEEKEPEFDEAAEVQNIWDKISSLMEQFGIDKQEALQISKRRFNGREPYDLNNQELAAYMKFIELEGQVKKAQEQKQEKQQQAAKIEPDKEKESQAIQQEPEQQKEPQRPKNELDSFLDDLDSMFDKDGQGELF